MAECFTDRTEEQLFPQEVAALAGTVDRRRREFRTVRGCARLALAGLGLERGPMLPGEGGAPTWPAGVVGSMTHCAGYRAAVVLQDDVVGGVGIDAEPNQPLPRGVENLVSSPAERDHLSTLALSNPEISWDRLLFSAKESIYKVWYPIMKQWLGFEDATVRFSVAAGTFQIELTPARSIPAFRDLSGRWMVGGDLLLSAVTVSVL